MKQTIEVEVGPEDDAGTCLVVLGGTRHERWDIGTVRRFGLTVPEPSPEPIAEVVEWDVVDGGVLGCLIRGDDGEILHRPYERVDGSYWDEHTRTWRPTAGEAPDPEPPPERTTYELCTPEDLANNVIMAIHTAEGALMHLAGPTLVAVRR